MGIVLFLLYLVMGGYWLLRWSANHAFYRQSPYLLTVAFIVRVGIAVAFGHYARGLVNNDNWRFFEQSQDETGYLLHHFPDFIYKDIFDNNGYTGNPFTSFFFRNGNNMYFNDLRDNLVLKFEAILNVFSGSNYYTNQLLASFLTILALIGLIRVFTSWLRPRYPLLIPVFLLFYPPLLVWVSNIQKDMLCMMCLSVLFYIGTFRKQVGGWKKKAYLLLQVLSFLLVLLMKNYMALALAASGLAFWGASRFTRHQSRVYVGLFVGLLLFFALTSFFPSSINLPLLLARKQNGMYDIGGTQPLLLLPMDGSLRGYFRNIPYAALNTFLYPYHLRFWISFTNMLGMFSFLFFLFLLYGFFRYPVRPREGNNLYGLFLVGFCLLIYGIIGVTIPVYGAFLRYRAMPETFLFLWMAQKIDLNQLNLVRILKKYICLCFNKKI